MITILFYDYEVFKHYWCVVIADMETHQWHVIDNREELEDFYNDHKDDIWCGYNSKGYDQYIQKGILLGYDPKKVNDFIIDGGQGWQFCKDFRKVKLINYDAIVKRAGNYVGLKELEYHMGDSIVECDVDFNLDRELTDEEIKTVVMYCKNDVEALIRTFLIEKKTFNAKWGLTKRYNLPISTIDSTSAGITAKILKAERVHGRSSDEFDFCMPDPLKIVKYTEVVDWYTKHRPQYGESLCIPVHGLTVTYGLGGFHGAVERSVWTGFILDSDVKSLYPNLVIEYMLHSRNIPKQYIGIFEDIVKERLRLKTQINPDQESMKLVINAMTGSMGDKNNNLYDPLMRNLICIFGQVLMTDLIERLEEGLGNKFELIQVNTDGIFVKLESKDLFERYKAICNEWESRVGLELEHDKYAKMYQKDVNNYLAIKPDDTLHRKGAYVKELSENDYELNILNTALVEYFHHGTLPETTINNCNDLKEFQMLAKKSANYDYLMHGDEKLKHKYYRVYASKDLRDKGLYKVGKRGTKEKVAKSPNHCFIWNNSVNGVKCPEKLDKQYYIEMAWERIKQFVGYDPRQIRLF